MAHKTLNNNIYYNPIPEILIYDLKIYMHVYIFFPFFVMKISMMFLTQFLFWLTNLTRDITTFRTFNFKKEKEVKTDGIFSTQFHLKSEFFWSWMSWNALNADVIRHIYLPQPTRHYIRLDSDFPKISCYMNKIKHIGIEILSPLSPEIYAENSLM